MIILTKVHCVALGYFSVDSCATKQLFINLNFAIKPEAFRKKMTTYYSKALNKKIEL